MMGSRVVFLDGLTVVLVGACFASSCISPAQAQLEDLLGPLQQLGNLPWQPDELMSALEGKVEFTEKELSQIEQVRIPIKVERDYGERCVEHYRGQLKRQRIRLTKRGPEVAYLQKLVDQLYPLMKRASEYKELRVSIVESPDVMALAYPGRTILVYRGLLDFVPSEAALVGVLGHEISHIDRGHQLFHLKRVEMVRQTLSPQVFSWQALVASPSFLLKSMARPFRPEEERLADLDGAAWAFELGYDPRELAKVFQKMHEREVRQNPQNPQLAEFALPFLRTHPASEVRLREISRLSEELIIAAPQRPLYCGVRNLSQRKSRWQNEYPGEYSGQ